MNSGSITSGFGNIDNGSSTITTTGAITGGSFVIGSADINENDLESIDGITAGTVAASKAVVVDANKDATGFRNITLTGELDAGSLDVSGNVDVDGTLETDALSINGTAVTSTATELNILDGVTSTTAELNILDGVTSTAAELNILDGKAFLDEDNFASNSATGIASQQSIKAYVDGITATNITSTGALNSGSITSGFGNIDTGSSTITTTGLISGGSLDIDNVLINGTTIGHTDDTDLITLADGVVTVAGEVSMTTLDIGGTNVTSTASELNALDGITAVVGELNALDLGSTAIGTAIASKAVVIDANKDYTGIRNFSITGNLSVGGTTTVVDTVTMNAQNAVLFEGATADAHETTLTIVDPTADRTISLPNQSGTVPVLAAASNTAITSTPEELNILDGVTATAAELNILDGVTSTAAELNILDGVTSTAAEINILDGVTSTAAELNILDGVTSTAAELNILDVDNSTLGDLSEISTVANDDVFLAIDTSGGGLKKITRSTVVSGLAATSNSLSNIVEDTTPQLGGNLDTNSHNILIDDAHFIGDESGNEQLVFQTTASAVNHLEITNNATGSNPILAAVGGDDNVGIVLTPKGTGEIVIGAGNLNYAGTAITSTGAEINILDGVTSTTAELNILDGVTSTAAELNILDGVTATAAELNILDGVTTTAAEINLIDGGTARGTTAVADGDGVLINDGGTMRMTKVDTLSTYMSGKSVGGANIVTTGALNSGTITSGFGTIDTGSSAITTTGLISGGSLDIDNVLINGTTIGHTDDTDLMTVADGLLTVAGEVSMTTLDIGGTNVTSTAAELNVLDGITAVVGELNALDIGLTAVGTAVASKAVILDSNKDYTGMRNLTISGELDAGSLDISGNADIDGTLEADAITVNGTALAEVISDTVGAMVSSNTESGITVTYQDADNTLDFAVGTLNQNTTGSAATLTTARAIAVAGDVTGTANFDGSAGISITTTLAANAIVTANITDGNVTVAKMAANSIDSAQYVDGSIDRAHLAADIIDGTKIADDAINSEHYAAGSIDNEHIADNAINSEHYADGSIDRAHLAADIIDGTKIANDAINSEHYVAGSIDAEHLASDSVTEAKMAANSVDSQAYVDGSIDQVHLANAIVNEAKMQISNAPQNGYFLSAQSGNTGGLTWAVPTDTNTTYSVGDGGLTQNNFTNTLKSKLDGIASSANNYSHPTSAGNKHIPSGGAANQILVYSSSGTAVWADPSGGASIIFSDNSWTNTTASTISGGTNGIWLYSKAGVGGNGNNTGASGTMTINGAGSHGISQTSRTSNNQNFATLGGGYQTTGSGGVMHIGGWWVGQIAAGGNAVWSGNGGITSRYHTL